MDVAFIIDSSGSIGRKNWERMKRFVKSIVSQLDVSSSATRTAAVVYSTNPEVVILFSNFQGTDSVNRVFDAMRWQRGYTYTDKALLLANRVLFQTSSGMRLNVPKVSNLVVIFRVDSVIKEVQITSNKRDSKQDQTTKRSKIRQEETEPPIFRHWQTTILSTVVKPEKSPLKKRCLL